MHFPMRFPGMCFRECATNMLLVSFPNSQFFVERFKMQRKDRTKTRRGLLLYVNENLPGS